MHCVVLIPLLVTLSLGDILLLLPRHTANCPDEEGTSGCTATTCLVRKDLVRRPEWPGRGWWRMHTHRMHTLCMAGLCAPLHGVRLASWR
jgi:hypothetical protein